VVGLEEGGLVGTLAWL